MKTHARPVSAQAWLFGLAIHLASPGVALGEGELILANTPLTVPKAVAPNVILTLDDSQTMAMAFTPDLCGGTYPDSTCPPLSAETTDTLLDTRRFKSAHFNPMYYNPAVTYPAPLASNPTTFASACQNGFDCVNKIDLGTQYRPSTYYDTSGQAGPLSPERLPGLWAHLYAKHPAQDFAAEVRETGTQAYYYVYDKNISGCSDPVAQKNNDACYSKVLVTDAEKQNFANWYSFYRTRNLATISAASRAVSSMTDEVRVAWQGLATCFKPGTGFFGRVVGTLDAEGRCRGWRSSASYQNRLRRLGDNRADLNAWMAELPATGNITALRAALWRAGNYFKNTGRNSAYDNLIDNDSDDNQYACRQNFNIIITDGMWDDAEFSFFTTLSGGDLATAMNFADKSFALPDSTLFSEYNAISYSPKAPFQDGSASHAETSLSDLALYFWANDLATGIDNKNIPYILARSGSTESTFFDPRNDPATWQHLVNFTVGVGLTGFLGSDWDASASDGTFAGAYSCDKNATCFQNGSRLWPEAKSPSSPGVGSNNVYDLWHAAINSRGRFFSADDPDRLNAALTAITEAIQARASTASATLANSTRLSSDTVVYQAGFNSLDWSGSLKAYCLSSSTGVIQDCPDGVAEFADGSGLKVKWRAEAQLPAAAARNIWTRKEDGAVVSFSYDNLSTGQQARFSPLDGAQRVNYLRGDTTLEGTYRRRTARLGDIVNSDPAFVGTDTFGYEVLAEGSAYRDYVESKKARKKMVYVGANDGMLHGFDAETGVERFAYVPTAALAATDLNGANCMNKMADPDYIHCFLVDGSPFVGDAHLGGTWKTVLVSGLGAGGKAVFALDVSQPENFNGSHVLWEISNTTPGFEDLGHTFGQPIIVRLNNGKWAAVFGNGVNSASGKAVLYVVDLADGALIKKIDTGVGDTTTRNGLMQVTAYDSARGDRVTDYLYAGDLLGNVWKFSLADDDANPATNLTDTDTWGVAYKLFTAVDANGNPQPITAPIAIGAKSGGSQSEVMLYFGTGRFLAKDDNVTTGAQTQSFYGLLDNGGEVGGTGRSLLVAQSLTETTQSFAGISQTLRTASNNGVSYPSQRGWYVDLPTQGERVVNTALLRHGRVIFASLIPSSDPCDFGGDSWLMELVADNGNNPDESVFDLNEDTKFDSADYVNVNGAGKSAAGIKSRIGVIDIPAVVTDATSEIKVAFGSRPDAQGNRVLRVREKGGEVRSGRVSWREIID